MLPASRGRNFVDEFNADAAVSGASGTTTYGYDAFGNQARAIRPKGTINVSDA